MFIIVKSDHVETEYIGVKEQAADYATEKWGEDYDYNMQLDTSIFYYDDFYVQVERLIAK